MGIALYPMYTPHGSRPASLGGDPERGNGMRTRVLAIVGSVFSVGILSQSYSIPAVTNAGKMAEQQIITLNEPGNPTTPALTPTSSSIREAVCEYFNSASQQASKGAWFDCLPKDTKASF